MYESKRKVDEEFGIKLSEKFNGNKLLIVKKERSRGRQCEN